MAQVLNRLLDVDVHAMELFEENACELLRKQASGIGVCRGPNMHC
jgi:hypothetical protein